MATPQEVRLVHRTVAATLRQIATWGSSGPENAEEWYELAQSVSDGMTCDWPGCAMCEEATCDDDCPLFGYKMKDSDNEEADIPQTAEAIGICPAGDGPLD